ncbi:MAG TPA: methyltransferase domain-containing protein [Aliidongia sp.]|nr:methyltransferase domain-containing protein [Aliidongia sp.]
MSSVSHHSRVASQFGPRAAAYVASAVHAQGEDLQQLAELVRARPGARLLDLGSGGGHLSYAAAPHASEVVAYDLSAEMLGAVAATASERGIGNIATRQGPVETLPFEAASFDIVATRMSAHHWLDFPAALREARRVLKPDGVAFFIDIVSPGPGLLDTHFQAIELLRDPSHVRDYTMAEWLEAVTAAGFMPQRVTRRRLRIDYASWIERMGTAPEHAVAIRSLQSLASDEVRRHFEIEADGSFTMDAMSLEATPR